MGWLSHGLVLVESLYLDKGKETERTLPDPSLIFAVTIQFLLASRRASAALLKCSLSKSGYANMTERFSLS